MWLSEAIMYKRIKIPILYQLQNSSYFLVILNVLIFAGFSAEKRKTM